MHHVTPVITLAVILGAGLQVSTKNATRWGDIKIWLV